MAATSINNLAGLDAVTGITANDETLIIATVQKLLSFDNGKLVGPMLTGAIDAEGFIDIEDGGIRVQLTVATKAQINFIPEGANKIKAEVYTWKDSAWVLAIRHQIVEGVFSEYVTP